MDAMTIRQKFLDYFSSHQHRVIRSSSLVPSNDPTLYFTNAGMVQFKDVFTGDETRDYQRACSSQKCLRVSGKHNDLENVGRTSRHHTFFEMLGNFSFGDYFKEEAIHHAWEFLTVTMGLDKERMAATVFRGTDDIPGDEQAYKVWREDIGLSPEQIFRLDEKDNFWSMGNVGPCGPCSEVHYHQGDHLPCPEPACLGVACECDRWVEVWNLVFMQFNRDSHGALTPLAATGVDTGMGLERLVAVVQGVLSTYDTDLILPIIQQVAELANKRYGEDADDDVSMRVVADHARATAFCIADGVFPEKGGREYVLRRIMRRAIRHGKRLGFDEPFFDQVCAKVVQLMHPAFPELAERAEVITTIARAEETSFRRTLGRGLQKLQAAIDEAHAKDKKDLPVSFVGDLYATDGFPIDLTRVIAEEQGLMVDDDQAHCWVMETHGAAESRVGDQAVDKVYKALQEEHGRTEFMGHEAEESASRVLALIQEGALVQQAVAGDEVEVLTAATPLYGKAGGQVGDTGAIIGSNGELEVLDTLKPGGEITVHLGQVKQGTIKKGDEVTLRVDRPRRQAIRLNHSATHLLHHALREILGDHVAQKGSEVSPAALRFDYSHFEGLDGALIQRIEQHVNAEIRRDAPSSTRVMGFEDAQQQGAMALFGEKYGDEVRVVHIGGQSVELCGGTHVARAGEIGLFKIVSEEALALGVRRISAVTGAEALARVQQQEARMRHAAGLLRCGPEEVPDKVEKLQAQLKIRQREVGELKRQLATGGSKDLMDQVQDKEGVRVLITRVDAADPKTLREAGDTLKDRLGSGVVVLAGEHNHKATLLVMVTKDLTDRYHAGKMVRELTAILGGKGGGRPEMAQGGGPCLDCLDEALAKALELI